MRVRQADLTHGKLESFGVRATQFLCKRDFRSLTKWLPYAVAYDRDHAEAIRDDLSSWLRPGDHVLAESLAEYRVKYFAPNDIPLVALIECRVPTQMNGVALLELVVIGMPQMTLAIEGVSCGYGEET